MFLICLLFNARSICNKVHELYQILCESKYDFIFITESWLNENITNSFLLLNYGYSIFRKDRIGKKGGGVAVVFRNSLFASEVNIPERFQLAETLVFDLVLKLYEVRFLLIYRSPNCNEIHLGKLKNLIDWVYNSSNQCIILGDFNFPQIKWNNSPIQE